MQVESGGVEWKGRIAMRARRSSSARYACSRKRSSRRGGGGSRDRQASGWRWRFCTGSGIGAARSNVDGYVRMTTMSVCMTGIARAAGMPLETEVTAAIAAALSKDRPVQDA